MLLKVYKYKRLKATEIENAIRLSYLPETPNGFCFDIIKFQESRIIRQADNKSNGLKRFPEFHYLMSKALRLIVYGWSS